MNNSEEAEDDNTIFVGSKSPMSYVIAILTEFEKSSRVFVKARGKAISKAVEASEIVRKKYMDDVEVIEIKIDTENIVDSETDEPMDIPSIEIVLGKPVVS